MFGALDAAFRQMGEIVLADMDLIERGLPPNLCKRAERETVARLRSRPDRVNGDLGGLMQGVPRGPCRKG